MQQLVEESTYRNELQMQLDSKESDIEQLREKLNDLQLRMENTSVTSLQTDEVDSNTAGVRTRSHTPVADTSLTLCHSALIIRAFTYDVSLPVQKQHLLFLMIYLFMTCG